MTRSFLGQGVALCRTSWEARYDPTLVAISVLVAILASYVALDLTARVNAARRLSSSAWQPVIWGMCGALAMGTGIWSMHFIGMLALQLDAPIRYGLAPLVGSVLPAIAAVLPEVHNAPVSDVGGRESILVVEDEAVVRRFIASALTRIGYSVTEAASAVEAMALLANVTPDLLLSDVVIPGEMNGVGLCAAATALYPNLRTLLMSGYADQPMVIVDGQPFIQKPFTPHELGAMVRDALGREAARR